MGTVVVIVDGRRLEVDALELDGVVEGLEAEGIPYRVECPEEPRPQPRPHAPLHPGVCFAGTGEGRAPGRMRWRFPSGS